MPNRYPAYESRKIDNAAYNTAVINDLSTKTTDIPSTESAYTTATNIVKEKVLDLVNRLSSDNPYSGKSFGVIMEPTSPNPILPVIGSGNGGYVTKQGVFKPYSAPGIAGTNDCPLISTSPLLSNAQTDNYKYAKSLKQGTPIVTGQTCGNEGKNVYTSKLITNPTRSYIGCYNDKYNSLNQNNLGLLGPTDGSVSLISKINTKTSFGTKSLDDCKQYAAENDYQYFTMQKNADTTYTCTAFNSSTTRDYDLYNDASLNTTISSDVVVSSASSVKNIKHWSNSII
jgi:hypothetical protein